MPSTSTEATDRREKLIAYRSLPSLLEYVLISQDEASIEILTDFAAIYEESGLEF